MDSSSLGRSEDAGPTITLSLPEFSRADGLCVNCKADAATEDWCPGGALAWTHGMVYAWCKRCVLTEQIRHCQEMADALPGLQAELAALDISGGDVDAGLRTLRKLNSTKRGLHDDFLRMVARKYQALREEGEPYPAKVLANTQHADKSTASRWLKAARERGFLPAPTTRNDG